MWHKLVVAISTLNFRQHLSISYPAWYII